MRLALIDPFISAAISALEGTGLLVGDAVAPAGVQRDSQGLPLYPYLIVYPMPTGGTSGPMGAVHEDEDMVVHVNYIGRTAQAARWAADKGYPILMRGFPIPGRALMSRPQTDFADMLPRDDDTAGPPLFAYAHRIRYRTTPA